MRKNVAHLSYHLFVIVLSAAAALTMPFLISVMAENMLTYRAAIENEQIFLVAIEIATAVTLILLFNLIHSGLRNRRLANTARSAGLVASVPLKGLFLTHHQAKSKRMKNKQGFAREIMVIGSTGYGSFVKPEGDLFEAVQNCREAKIMLLDPREQGAIARAQSIPDPEITTEVIREQIMKSIEYIKGQRARKKTVRLKLYPDMPLLKMAILGDYAYIRHYHTGLNIRLMPEFAFRNIQHHGGLYMPMYRYFLSRWQDADIPEYDLDTDELVYHDHLGYEVLREPFNGVTLELDTNQSAEETSRSRYVFRL